MAINFPNSPNLYDVYNDPVSKNSYIWGGDYWAGFTTSTSYINLNIPSIFVEDDSSPVGFVTTLDFGNNLTVSPNSSGIVTVTATGGGGGGESYWVKTSVGIHTLSNVGIGTTNPTSRFSVLGDVSIASTISGSVSIDGGIIYASNSTSDASTYLRLSHQTGETSIGRPIEYGGNFFAQNSTSGNDLEIAANGVNAGSRGDIVFYRKGVFNPKLEIARLDGENGNFTIGQENITPSGNFKAYGNVDIVGVTTTSTLNVGVGGTIITVTDIGFVGIGTTLPKTELNVVGVVSATSFYGDGSTLTNISLDSLTDAVITSPASGESLSYNGTHWINDYNVTATTTNTNQTTLHSLSVSSYRSVEYLIQISEGTNYQISKILAIHNGTNASSTEYGTLYTNGSLATFVVDISSGNMRLRATSASSSSTEYKIKFTAIKI